MAVLDQVTEGRARKAIEALSRHAHVRAAYVFGSHAEGTADMSSDIDIAAFIEELEQWDLRRRAQTAALVQKQAGDDLELHFFPASAFAHAARASFAAYVLRHGVPIHNDP